MNKDQEKTVSIQRTPELIAAEINHIKNETRKIIIYNSIEIGRRLVEAKAMLPHGSWGDWLEKSVEYSQRTASNFMKVFEEYGADQMSLLGGDSNVKSQAFANLSYTQAIALLQVPAEEREDFVKENNVEDLSTRELEKVIKERDKALKKLEKVEKEKQQAIKDKEAAEKEKQNLVEATQALDNTITSLKAQIQEAESSGNTEDVEDLLERLKTAEGDLNLANIKVSDLEQKLKEKPLEPEKVTVTEIVEKIPEEVMQELENLRKIASEKETSSSVEDQSIVKFSVRFEGLVDNFRKTLETLSEIPEESIENYKGAIIGLIDKMKESLS